MHLLWLDPFHGGSHAAVAAGYAAHSRHRVALLSLPIDGGWRWRMRGGAISLARMALERELRPDLIVATDMLDLATFRALTARALGHVPAAVYFHENQLTYPLPPGRQRDLGLAWVNYTAALAADAVIFNSAFHRRDFLAALPGLLGRYHDFRELATIDAIAAKSIVLPPGIDLAALDLGGGQTWEALETSQVHPPPPTLLWNSRWEYDKQPEIFFQALEELESRGVDFRLIVAGEPIDPNAPAFAAARARWAPSIAHWGYAGGRGAYAALLRRADIVVSAALQEFFGIGVVEALYCGCVPVLPHRLNYPDLIPPELHGEALYRRDADLADALARAIAGLPELRGRPWRSIAAAYDWSILAPRYDEVFAGVARRG